MSNTARHLRRSKAEGWRVLRVWNNDILTNTEGVVVAMLEALGSP